jgi:hypothetical protein
LIVALAKIFFALEIVLTASPSLNTILVLIDAKFFSSAIVSLPIFII